MKHRYDIYFYTFVDGQGNFETIEGEQVVNVGISTKPGKSLSFQQKNTNKTVFVLLIKNISDQDKEELLKAIEELRVYKSWYKFEPLAGLIRRKCKETNFIPYKMKNDKSKMLDEGPRGVLVF